MFWIFCQIGIYSVGVYISCLLSLLELLSSYANETPILFAEQCFRSLRTSDFALNQKLWYDLEIEMQKAAKLFWSEGKNAFICFVHYLNWLLLCCSSEKQITKKNFLYRADHSMHFLLFPARPSQHLSLIQGHQNHYSWGDLMNFSLSALDDAMLAAF